MTPLIPIWGALSGTVRILQKGPGFNPVNIGGFAAGAGEKQVAAIVGDPGATIRFRAIDTWAQVTRLSPASLRADRAEVQIIVTISAGTL